MAKKQPAIFIFLNGFKLLMIAIGLLFAAIAAGAAPEASSGARYNEVVDENGQLRPAYRQFEKYTGFSYQNPSARHMQLMHAFMAPYSGVGIMGDSIRVAPAPLLLTPAEDRTLREGSAQRFRALSAFFYDLAIGEQKAIKRGGFIPRAYVDHALGVNYLNLQSLRRFWRGKTASDIRFFGGTDSVRNRQGEFVALEDNVGRLGGIVDKDMILVYLEGYLGYSVFSYLPGQYYALDAQRFILQVERNHSANDWMLVIIDPNDEANVAKKERDMETARLLKIITLLAADGSLNLVIAKPEEAKNVYHQEVAKRGLPRSIFNWQEPLDLNANIVFQHWLYEEVFQKSEVRLYQAPGTRMLSSKLWLPYVEKMIEFYLNETPIIKTHSTIIVEKDWVPTDKNWVVKNTEGAGGKEVLIMQNLSDDAFKMMQEQFRINSLLRRMVRPDQYHVAQRFLPMSYLDVFGVKLQVDIRPAVFVNGLSDVMVGITHFGRATPLGGSGLNNTSSGGLEIPIVVLGGEYGVTLEKVTNGNSSYNECGSRISTAQETIQK